MKLVGQESYQYHNYDKGRALAQSQQHVINNMLTKIFSLLHTYLNSEYIPFYDRGIL